MNINSNTAFGTLNNNNHEEYSQTSTLIREWKKEESISLSLKREVKEKFFWLSLVSLTSALFRDEDKWSKVEIDFVLLLLI